MAISCGVAGSTAGSADGRWRALPPPDRLYRYSFVDPVDGQLTCFADSYGGSAWKFDLVGTGGWTPSTLPGSLDASGEIADIRFDRVGRRLVAVTVPASFDSTQYRADSVQVWTLALDGERRWRRLPIPGPPPPPRFDPMIALDPEGGRLFLVGGRASVPFIIIDGKAVPDRSASSQAAAATAADVYYGDVWKLDLAGGTPWSEVVVAGEGVPGMLGGYACFEPTEGRLVVAGADDSLYDGTSDEEKVHAIAVDGDRRWVRLLETAGVSVRWPLDRITQGVDGRLIVVRGQFGTPSPATPPAIRRLDLRGAGTVEDIVSGGSPLPSPYYTDPLCIDPETNRLVLAGTSGSGSGGELYVPGGHADVWALPLDGAPTWSRLHSTLAADVVSVRSPVVLDPARRRAVVVNESSSVIWTFPLDGEPAWQLLSTSGGGPQVPRDGEVVVFDPPRDRLLLFGGSYNNVEFGDLWELSFAFSPPRWRRILDDADTPRPRTRASAIYDPVRRRMVLFGGFAGEERNDTWELDLRAADPRWREIPPRGVLPPARWGHTAVYDSRRDAMIVYGGATGTLQNPAPFRDTWILSFVDGDTWVPLPIGNATPPARLRHGAVYDPVADRMLVLGGVDRNGVRFDHQSLELGASANWSGLLPQGTGPQSAFELSALYDPLLDRVLTFGPDLRGRVTALEWDRDTTPKPDPVAGGFRILGMGPNPTAGDVGIGFEVPKRTDVSTRIYDVRGRVVRNLGTTSYSSGPHLVWWDGRGDGGEPLRDGVYFARITLDGQSISGKIILMD